MDKARYFEYVYRLAESNRNQLSFKEDVFDKQILLNEEWSEFALRRGRGEAVAAEEHVKWITETWEECEERKHSQRLFLDESDRASEVQRRLSDDQKKKRKEKSNSVIGHLMRYQNEVDKSRTPCRHNLYVDFQALQQDRFRLEREMVEFEEYFIRTKIEEWENCQTFLLGCAMQWSYAIHDLAIREREAREEAERQRIEDEKKRAEEERIRLEEQRKRDEEEAERQRREQAEIDKRLERKRREEMRRAKSRAERQKQQIEQTEVEMKPEVLEKAETVEAVAEPEAEPGADAEVEPEPELEAEPEAEEIVPLEAPNRHVISFRGLVGENVVSLLNCTTEILSSGGDHSYIMSIKKDPCSSTVISQNGIFGVEEREEAPLLGKRIEMEKCVSISSTALHDDVSNDLEGYLSKNVEHIRDVRMDERCVVFREGAAKNEETLVLFPVSVPSSPHSPFVIALCREGHDSVTPDEIFQMGKLVFDLGIQIREMFRRMFTNQLCQQCVDWLSLCMGCDNVYISLGAEGSECLTYVASTPSHRFLLGMTHTKADEMNGSGISHKAMELSIPEKRCLVTNFPDVSKPAEGALPTENIRFFQDTDRKGPLMIAPITGCRDDVGVSLGCVFVDRIGSKKKFSSADEEVMRMATQMLADIMLGNIPLETAVSLKIEEEVDPSSLTFLKILWDKCLQNLENITSNQLLELAKYLHPPPVIPKVVQGTLLVTLRCKPSKISEWDNARKKVTQKLLTKMSKFDPTNTALTKNAFFVRARKLVKGLTAEEVFEKGSYPTQCFFNWLFAAMLLRKHTMAVRKKTKLGVMDFDDNMSLGSFDSTGESAISGDDEDEADTETDAGGVDEEGEEEVDEN